MAWFKGKRSKKTFSKKRTTKKSSKYSADQKKAFFMGLGAGIAERGRNQPSDNLIDMLDSRMGEGQRKDLCDSALKGYFEGKKNYSLSPVFALGFKKYPVSHSAYIKDDKKK